MVLEVRDSFYLGLLSIFGSGKEGFSFKGLFGEEKYCIFGFWMMFLRLGKGVNLPMEDLPYA